MPRVFVPKALKVAYKGATLSIEAGVQHIPDELTNDWWLKANGVLVIRPM